MDTPRLVLRRWGPDDRAEMASIWADPAVWNALRPNAAFDPDFVEGRLEHHLGHWVEHGFGLFAVEERASGSVVGWTGPWHPVFAPDLAEEVELGWTLRPSAWGRGLAVEAAGAALEAAFECLAVEEVISLIHPENVRSASVAHRLGMRHLRDTRHAGLDMPLRVYVSGRDGEAVASPRREGA